MASITVRQIEDSVKTKLKVRAAENGRSMEEEVRCILALAAEAPGTSKSNEQWFTELRHLVGEHDFSDLDIPKREPDMGRIPDFSGPEFDAFEQAPNDST